MQQAVALHFGVTLLDVLSSRQTKRVILPRQVAMWIARHATVRSLPEIGRMFRRDHTTVMSAIAKVDALMARDSGFDAEVRALLLPFLPVDGAVA